MKTKSKEEPYRFEENRARKTRMERFIQVTSILFKLVWSLILQQHKIGRTWRKCRSREHSSRNTGLKGHDGAKIRGCCRRCQRAARDLNKAEVAMSARAKGSRTEPYPRCGASMVDGHTVCELLQTSVPCKGPSYVGKWLTWAPCWAKKKKAMLRP